ncbi:MGDG synthase family glycosyltransferase [Paenibacillus harenae]|uniref:Processive 1,2-diacylglycerol beta-glucosyltransferase n=1 Tax=Paenibacillus harenae TaxID=306543 RepID=A0ABT9U4U9_PAEHA|nr:glycosyltransferase [Paenibacillus harenae]MDQ0114664.1 processive 1,2-diacylglycerol beta-glucosyltransferase [Paenibacillus harenae]
MIRSDYNRHPKLLILYASYGDGHLQVSRAIQGALEERGNYRSVMIDLMAESHPWLNEVTRRFYQQSYTLMPSLYGWMYDVTKPIKHNSLLGGLLHSFGSEKIRRIIAAERPDAVIHTFPLLAVPPIARRRRASYHPPSYAVITDFDLHRRWVHPSIDRYYVATEDLKQELAHIGVPGGRVQVSGIPLRRSFRTLDATDALYGRYGLSPDRPVVLMMPGAQGTLADLGEICSRLLSHPGLQIALVCGRNEQLRTATLEQFALHPEAERLRVYGFIDTIHELMSLASCILTKPGGVTLSEAIAAKLPIFAYRPVPGQEKQNAKYLSSKGAATIARDPAELCAQIMKLIDDPIRLTNSRLVIEQLQTAQTAADSIVSDILSRHSIMGRASIL